MGQGWISMDPAPGIRKMCGVRNITSYYVYDPWGLVAKMTGGQTYFYHFDGLGSTIAMTNASGSIVNKYAYDEYGNVLASVEGVSNPFKYVGRYGIMHDDTGLLYMRARYYDPEVGRFISRDPIGFAGGDINLYAYVAANPVTWVDPLGLIKFRELLNDSRLRSFASLGAAKLAEYGATKLGPGKTRGVVYAVSGGLAMFSALEAMKYSVASYVVAATTAPTGVTAAAGYVFGTGFAVLAVYDAHLAASYFQKALEDFGGSELTSQADQSCP